DRRDVHRGRERNPHGHFGVLDHVLHQVPGSALTMTVLDAGGSPLGSAQIAQSAFPSGCNGWLYFDLSASCIKAQSGAKLTFVMDTVGEPMPSCIGHMCTWSNQFCQNEFQCFVQIARIGTSSSDAYAGGQPYYPGHVQPTNDATFITFVE